MTEQLKAEAYVRSQRPALMKLTFGCEVIVAGIAKDNPGCEHDVVVDVRKDEHGRIGMGYFGHVHPDDFTVIIGHPIQLQDWLAVLGEDFFFRKSRNVLALISNKYFGIANSTVKPVMLFNLTTGQPATQQDYQSFNEITSV